MAVPRDVPQSSDAENQSSEADSTANTSRAAALTLGRKFGAYEILRKLGEGGMGAVYLARHSMLDKLVALKVLPPHQSSDPEAILRFQREMRAVGQLAHPNVVGALDAGNVDGLPYLVMEYVEGVDLAKFVQRRGPLSPRDACSLIRQAALGLAAAHERGLVHRDIKPSNLLVTKHGQLKILDLGLAKLLLEDSAQFQLTHSGHIVGTPDYMAPEQWDADSEVDARTDLYALGCTLYFALTGKSPFRNQRRSSLRQIMNAHLNETPPSLEELRPDVPANMCKLCDRLMAKSPEERVGSARELASQLQQIERLTLQLPTGFESPPGVDVAAKVGASNDAAGDA
ncbi:MAG TPA: serine/threonine-protein kinase, partial [Pirellulaceae bacterium]|nr:serine/threonine-protein kinase [Pirellulaceae bacterium]